MEHPSMARSLAGGILEAAVLILDMSGFSSLVAKFKDHPQAAAFLARHFLDFVDRAESSLNEKKISDDTIRHTFYDKMIGDAVMLVVTGPRLAAVGGALDIVDLVTADGLYRCKAGLHWGKLWLGDIGFARRPERPDAFRTVTVMGHVVNVAARLLHEATEPLEVALLGEGLDGAEAPLDGITPPASLVRLTPDAEACVKGVLEPGKKVRIAKLRQTSRLMILETMKPEKIVQGYLDSAGPPAPLD